MRRVIRWLAGLLLAAILWFLLVDWSWYVGDCPRCFHSRDVFQYRFAGLPVWTQTREYHSLIEKVAAELGEPCSHEDLPSWHKQRWWGLCFCAAPCHNGTFHVSTDEVSQDTVVLMVRRRAGADPNVRAEFEAWFKAGRDWGWWGTFISSLSQESTSPTSP